VPLCVGIRAEIGALCKAKSTQAIPPCAPRYRALPTVRTTWQASFPSELLSSQWRHILCASRHATRAGVEQSKGTRIWRRRSWRHPRIQSSARTRQVRPPRWICTSSSRRRARCTKTGIPALSSTFAIACGIRGGVQENLPAILARPFVGRFCGACTNFTNVRLPTRCAPRGRILRKYGAAVEMLLSLSPNFAPMWHKVGFRKLIKWRSFLAGRKTSPLYGIKWHKRRT
jgi:hypothetical protein